MRFGQVAAVAVVFGLLATSGCSALTVHRGPAGGRGGGRAAALLPTAAAGAHVATPTPTRTPTDDPVDNPFAGRVPVFAPGPVPQPIALTNDGASAPIYDRLPVTQPVAFLTMDDGQVRLPQAVPLMQAAHIPFTMFLIAPVAAANPVFFQQLQAAGGVIEDHTMTHPDLRGRSYAAQREQVCAAVQVLTGAFGVSPHLFRPPYGDYDRTTLRAVHDCGLTAALGWSETVNNGKVYYQTSLHRIRPGDIILMHFRHDFVADVLAALTAIHRAGLTPALLEDYLI